MILHQHTCHPMIFTMKSRIEPTIADFGTSTLGSRLVLAALWLLGNVSQSRACAVCYGDPNSPGIKAVNYAVWFLLGVIASVLSVIAWVGVHWSHKARQIDLARAERTA